MSKGITAVQHEKKIAVYGSSQPREGTNFYVEAYAVGYALAEAGYTVVNGGYRGVMEASSKGAREAGGKTIGITTAFFSARNIKPNAYTDSEICVPTYGERLLKLVGMSDGYVVMRGGSGTLNELFCTWELIKNRSLPHRPIILYGEHWRRIIDFLRQELSDELSFSSFLHLLAFAVTPEEVIELLRCVDSML